MPKVVMVCVPGMKVVRGQDWSWPDQDKNSEYGLVRDNHGSQGWVTVDWYDKNDKRLNAGYGYRIGAEGKYDLYEYEKNKIPNFKVGDEVYIYRRGSEDDWWEVGSVSDDEMHPFNVRLIVTMAGEEDGNTCRDQRWVKLKDPTKSKDDCSTTYPSNIIKSWAEYATGIRIGDIIPKDIATEWVKIGFNFARPSDDKFTKFTGSGSYGVDFIVEDYINLNGERGVSSNDKNGSRTHLKLEGLYKFITSKGVYIQSSIKTDQHDPEHKERTTTGFNQESRLSTRHTGIICEVRRPNPSVSTGKRSAGTVIAGRPSKVRSSTGHRSYQKISS